MAISNTIAIIEDGFVYKKQFYFFNQIEKIRFYYEVTNVRHSFQHIGDDHQADLDLYIDVLKKPIKIRTGVPWTHFTIGDTKGRANSVLRLYSIIAEQTFELRVNKYLTELKTKGFFTYDNKMLYLDGRVVSPNFTLNIITDKPIYKEPFWLLYKTEKNIKSGLFGKKDFYIYTYFDKDVFIYLLKKLYKISYDKDNILFQDSTDSHTDEESFIKKANEKYKLGDYKNAIQDNDKAIEINPNFAAAYNNRGRAKYMLGDWKEAAQDFTKAIEIDSNYAEAYNNLGQVKSYSLAIQNFTKAIEINPNFAEAYFNRGNKKHIRGLQNSNLEDYKGAMQDYTKAIELNLNYSEAYYFRGEVKNDLGDTESACKDWAKASKLGMTEASDSIKKYCKQK